MNIKRITIFLFTLSAIGVYILGCKKEKTEPVATANTPSPSQVDVAIYMADTVVGQESVPVNDPLMLNFYSMLEFKNLDTLLGVLNLSAAIKYKFNHEEICAIDIPFSVEGVDMKVASTYQVSYRSLMVYYYKSKPYWVIGRQIKSDYAASGGYVTFFDESGYKWLKVVADGGKLTGVVDSKSILNPTVEEKKDEKKETWSQCMKRAIDECGDDLTCAITCSILSAPCMVGFALGCSLQQIPSSAQ